MKNIVPIKIDVVQKREGKITSNQIFFMFLFALLALFVLIFGLTQSMKHELWYVVVAGIVVTAIVFLICIRLFMKFGLNEKALYQQFLEEKDNLRFTIADYWDIISIEDNGRIIFKNGKNAFVIKMDRTSIIGKPDDYQEVHYAAVTKMIKQLVMKECIVKKYKLVVSDANIDQFSWLEERVAKRTNKSLRKMCNDIIMHNKEITVGKNNRSVEYWVVYCRVSNKNDYTDIKAILSGSTQTIYKPVIEDSKGVYDFLYKFTKLEAMNFKSAMYSNLDKGSVAFVDKSSLVPISKKTSDLFAPIADSSDILDHKYRKKLESVRGKDE